MVINNLHTRAVTIKPKKNNHIPRDDTIFLKFDMSNWIWICDFVFYIFFIVIDLMYTQMNNKMTVIKMGKNKAKEVHIFYKNNIKWIKKCQTT